MTRADHERQYVHVSTWATMHTQTHARTQFMAGWPDVWISMRRANNPTKLFRESRDRFETQGDRIDRIT